MARLINVSKAFADQRDRGEPVQDIHCLILRSDYMIDQPTHQIKLVEFNTIACSFGCLSNKVREMHSYVLEKYHSAVSLNYGVEPTRESGQYRRHIKADAEMRDLPIHADDHSYIDKLVAKFFQAIALYQQGNLTLSDDGPENGEKPWVLFVCEDDERNICDQKVIEVQL